MGKVFRITGSLLAGRGRPDVCWKASHNFREGSGPAGTAAWGVEYTRGAMLRVCTAGVDRRVQRDGAVLAASQFPWVNSWEEWRA